MTSSTKRKQRKSVPLSEGQVNYLKSELLKYQTKFDAAIGLGVNKDVVDRAIKFHSCSEKTYLKLFPEAKEEEETIE
jgi:hypothetical protein